MSSPPAATVKVPPAADAEPASAGAADVAAGPWRGERGRARSRSSADLKIGERRCRDQRVGATRHRQADIGCGGHANRRRTGRRPGRPVRGIVTGELVALPDETQPHRGSPSAASQTRRCRAWARSRLHEQTAARYKHQVGVARVGAQSLPDHHAGLRIRSHVFEAREPDSDVDIAGDLLVREPELVGGAPDVGSAASNHPRARRDGSAPQQSRTTDVPARPTCRQRGLRAHHAGADGQRAHQSHGGQSSAPNLSCRQNASPGKLSRAASTQRASRQCWPNGRIAFQTPQL